MSPVESHDKRSDTDRQTDYFHDEAYRGNESLKRDRWIEGHVNDYLAVEEAHLSSTDLAR